MNLTEATILALQNKLLKEDIDDNYITCYRTTSLKEIWTICRGDTVYGQYDNSHEKQNNSKSKNVVCFFTSPISWIDKRHMFMIECRFRKEDVEFGNGVYYTSGDLNKTLNWTGRRGKTESNVEEVYVKSYDLNDVTSFIIKQGLKDPLEWYEYLLNDDKEDYEYYSNDENCKDMKPEKREKTLQKIKHWIEQEEIIIKNLKRKGIKKL